MAKAFTKKQLKLQLAKFASESARTADSVIDFFKALGSPKAVAACSMFMNNEHEQLLDLDIDPHHYDCPEKFHLDYLAVMFLRKSTFLKTSYDLKERALEKFRNMELHCASVNQRFKRDPEQTNSELGHHLLVIRHKIASILGDFDIEEFFDNPSWGPGVSTRIKGCDTSAARKFQDDLGITRDLYALVGSSLSSAYPLWFTSERLADLRESIEAGNTVTTVPKNSKTDRVIAIEPGLNIFFQKSLGKMIRRRLRHRGIDLDDQTANQRFSLEGSLSGSLATVDFSSASDTISYEVVRNLLPPRWFAVLDAARSKRGLIDKTTLEWNKFSSMGNGFTFELETLIFYAMALAACEGASVSHKSVSVYGDDVIIPVLAYSTFLGLSELLGFFVNTEKSFASSHFRESCGSHYFKGVDVKPIYFRESLSDAFSVFKLANSIRRLAHRRNLNYGCDRRFLPIWRSLLRGVPDGLRTLKIPDGFGDGGFICNFDEATPSYAKHGHEGFVTKHARQSPITQRHDGVGLLLSRLSQVTGSKDPLARYVWRLGKRTTLVAQFRQIESTPGFGQSDPLRGRVRSEVSSLRVISWYDLGPWI